MFLPEYNSTQIQREPAKVFKAAAKEPIVINRMGNEGVVMMSKKKFAELMKLAGSK